MGLQEKNTTWYFRVLQTISRKMIVSAGLTLLILFIVAIVRLHMGATFEWRNIELIEQPDMMSKLIYSALVFVSLGAILYWLRFYKLLSLIFGSDRRGYRETKRVVWTALMLAMYFYIVPAIVNLLNSSISFVYNFAILVLYLSPLLFVFMVIALTAVIAVRYRVKFEVCIRTSRIRSITKICMID